MCFARRSVATGAAAVCDGHTPDHVRAADTQAVACDNPWLRALRLLRSVLRAAQALPRVNGGAEQIFPEHRSFSRAPQECADVQRVAYGAVRTFRRVGAVRASRWRLQAPRSREPFGLGLGFRG